MDFELNFSRFSGQKSQTLRPTSSISTFSERLNRKMQRFAHSEKDPGDKLNDLQIPSLPKIPHFGDLIEKIEEITERRKTINVSYQMIEGDPYFFNLTKKEKVRFQIETLNRVCPLTLNISKNIKPVTYVSSKHQLPDEDNCEKIFKNSCIFLSDKTHRFKTKTFFFCVVANESSEACISYEFRKKEDLEKTEKFVKKKDLIENEIQKIRNDSNLKQEFYLHVEKILEERKRNSLSNNKNFLQKNKTFKTPEEKKEMIKCRSEERVKRVKSVNLRKDSLYLFKKTKMVEFIIKQEARIKERREKEKKLKQETAQKNLVKFWLILMVFSYSCRVLKFKFGEFKKKKRASLISAKMIQKNYRRWNTKFFDNIAKEFIHCRNALLLFYNTSAPFTDKLKSDFIVFINTQISDMKPAFIFDFYIKKIIFIQRFFKNYINLRECLIRKGVKMWTLQISRIVKKFLKLNKKNNTFLNNILNIKDFKRYTFLKEYFREKCKNKKLNWYNFQTFLPSKNDLLKLIKNASLES